MSTYTEQDIKRMIEERNTLISLFTQRFDRIRDLRPSWKKALLDYPDFDEIEFGSETVKIHGSSAGCHRGCCGTEYHTYEFPLHYLWWTEEQVTADAAAEEKKMQKAAEVELQRKTEQDARAREEKERQQLKSLAEKYPDVVRTETGA